MHIPGKREHTQRNRSTRYFTIIQTILRTQGRNISIRDLINMPSAQAAAKASGDKRRLDAHRVCCEAANKAMSERQLMRLGMSPDHLALQA